MNDKKNGKKQIKVQKQIETYTKRYQPIACRTKFQLIYTEPIDLKEDDAHTIDLEINSLAKQNTEYAKTEKRMF